MNPAFIVVDVQNDFIPPDGALAVPAGDEVIPVINRVAKSFDRIVATQDWHPADHSSFAEFGGIWPEHCVQNTFGAELHQDLKIRPKFLDKVGLAVDSEGYSAFEEGPLETWLRDEGVDTLFFAGLATDYCVKASVLDGLKLGYDCYLIVDGCRAVNVNDGDDIKAIEEMRARGALIIESDQVDKILKHKADG